MRTGPHITDDLGWYVVNSGRYAEGRSQPKSYFERRSEVLGRTTTVNLTVESVRASKKIVSNPLTT